MQAIVMRSFLGRRRVEMVHSIARDGRLPQWNRPHSSCAAVRPKVLHCAKDLPDERKSAEEKY